jgi:hypothetical protein
VAGKEVAVKKYVIGLTGEERDGFNELIKRHAFRPTGDEGSHLFEGGHVGSAPRQGIL